MTEKEFQGSIIKLFKWTKWDYYHTHDSRRSNPGWPDLVMWHEDHPGLGIIYRELKKSDDEKPSKDQRRVLKGLKRCGADVQVWRPSDWPEIERLLVSFVSQPPDTPLRI